MSSEELAALRSAILVARSYPSRCRWRHAGHSLLVQIVQCIGTSLQFGIFLAASFYDAHGTSQPPWTASEVVGPPLGFPPPKLLLLALHVDLYDCLLLTALPRVELLLLLLLGDPIDLAILHGEHSW